MQRGFRGANVSVGFLPRVDALVELAAGDRAFVPQAIGALELARRVREPRLRGDELRLGAVDFSGIGCRIDRHQQVAGID